MSKNNIKIGFASTIVMLMIPSILLFQGCKSGLDTPLDVKHLQEFHLINFESAAKPLNTGLNLYVDYSTCNELGQNSSFFQKVSESLVFNQPVYYSIKGDLIQKEEGDTYTLLRNIKEVNYADLSTAANNIVNLDCESILITDGEYYTPSIAKGHDNDPYLAKAFEKWLLRGYDIHIISEPYDEPYKGKVYKKKRFYIIFTDDRLKNNIFERISGTVNFTQYPDIDVFHISACHPKLIGKGNNGSIQNQILESKLKGFGTFEIEDWDGCDWKTIEEEIVNAVNVATGESLKNGASIIQMGLDKNSFGGYRIKTVDLKVYDINEEYNSFYSAIENHEKPCHQKYELKELENFMLIDQSEFDKHSNINIYFNNEWFDPSILTGNPFNYFKLDIVIGDVQSIFDQHEAQFEFESISHPGEMNVSVASSIKQCLFDLKSKMKGQVIYSIYIKSEKY